MLTHCNFMQVNVYELLSDLLESSGVDRLDDEDPARMRASAQAKLAEITEVHHSSITQPCKHSRDFCVLCASIQRDVRLFTQCCVTAFSKTNTPTIDLCCG